MKAAVLLLAVVLPLACAQINLFASGVDGFAFLSDYNGNYNNEGLLIYSVSRNATVNGASAHLVQILVSHSLRSTPSTSASLTWTSGSTPSVGTLLTTSSSTVATVNGQTVSATPLFYDYYTSAVYYWNATSSPVNVPSGSTTPSTPFITTTNNAVSFQLVTTTKTGAVIRGALNQVTTGASTSSTQSAVITGKTFWYTSLLGNGATGCSGPGLALAWQETDSTSPTPFKIVLTGGALRIATFGYGLRLSVSTTVTSLASGSSTSPITNVNTVYGVSSGNWGGADRTLAVATTDFRSFTNTPELSGTFSGANIKSIPAYQQCQTSTTGSVYTFLRALSLPCTQYLSQTSQITNFTNGITETTGSIPQSITCGPSRRTRRATLQAATNDIKIVFASTAALRAFQQTLTTTAGLNALIDTLKAKGFTGLTNVGMSVAGVSGGDAANVFVPVDKVGITGPQAPATAQSAAFAAAPSLLFAIIAALAVLLA